MKKGDLVRFMSSYNLRVSIGIILRILEVDGPFGMTVYEIMKRDGTVMTYTSAAVRSIDDSC